MELTPADVDRGHRRRAPLEQAVGEAAGGRAGVQGPGARHVDPEGAQGGVELVSPPADEAGRWGR